MARFVTRLASERPDAVAPDGSEVRILAATARGSMALFRLAPGGVSKAVAHRTVEEVWYIVAGRGDQAGGGRNMTSYFAASATTSCGTCSFML